MTFREGRIGAGIMKKQCPGGLGPGEEKATVSPLRRLKRDRVNRQRLPRIRQLRERFRKLGDTPRPLICLDKLSLRKDA
jgi:hypothetical protein